MDEIAYQLDPLPLAWCRIDSEEPYRLASDIDQPFYRNRPRENNWQKLSWSERLLSLLGIMAVVVGVITITNCRH